MDKPDIQLAAQSSAEPEHIRLEREAIERAPKIIFSQNIPRCHFCGQVAQETVLHDVAHGIERHKGVGCCG